MARSNIEIAIPEELLLAELKKALNEPKHQLYRRTRNIVEDVQSDPYNAFQIQRKLEQEYIPSFSYLTFTNHTVEIGGTKVNINYQTNTATLIK